MLTQTGSYDDALERFHRTGPEYDGYLSNHGPMVVEVLARHNQDGAIDRWTDRYLSKLDELPRQRWPIDPARWHEALGEHTRSADWVDLLQRQLAEEPWRDVLVRWWPRLLPGIAAGATHGVIRVGHAVRSLGQLESGPRVAELAHALAYWAARYKPLSMAVPVGTQTAMESAVALPRVARQSGAFRDRLAQLDQLPGWVDAAATLSSEPDLDRVPAAVSRVADAMVESYPQYARGNPTMLVHAATAPNAVSMVLPELPPSLWPVSYAAAWTASAAVFALYAPARRHPTVDVLLPPDEVFAAAVADGGEHLIKFVDTAMASHRRTGNLLALQAASTAIALNA